MTRTMPLSAVSASTLSSSSAATLESVADDSIDVVDRIVADFRATMTQLKCASSERLLRLGISMAQLHIMYTIQRTGEMTMSHLAEVLDVSLSSATGLIDRMAERGFVERSRVPEDRRVVVVRLSPAGTRVLDEVDALSDDLLRTVLGRLDPAQRVGIAQATADLRAAVDATPPQPVPTPASDRHHVSTTAPRSQTTLRPSATDHLRRV